MLAVPTPYLSKIQEIKGIFELIISKININLVEKTIIFIYGRSFNSCNLQDILNIKHNHGLILASASLNKREFDIILN